MILLLYLPPTGAYWPPPLSETLGPMLLETLGPILLKCPAHHATAIVAEDTCAGAAKLNTSLEEPVPLALIERHRRCHVLLVLHRFPGDSHAQAQMHKYVQ